MVDRGTGRGAHSTERKTGTRARYTNTFETRGSLTFPPTAFVFHPCLSTLKANAKPMTGHTIRKYREQALQPSRCRPRTVVTEQRRQRRHCRRRRVWATGGAILLRLFRTDGPASARGREASHVNTHEGPPSGPPIRAGPGSIAAKTRAQHVRRATVTTRRRIYRRRRNKLVSESFTTKNTGQSETCE